MGNHTSIARVDRHAARSADVGRSTVRLPTEMLSEQVRRLAVFSTVGVVLWTFALAIEAILLPAVWSGWHRNWPAIGIELFGSIASAVMWVYMRSRAHAEQKNDVGPAMMLIHAVGIAVFNAFAYPPMGNEMLRVSWIALLILTYSMIAPSSPRRMLTASLIAATLDPLAYWAAWRLGGRAYDPVYLFVILWPTYACAFIAIVPARVHQRLGHQLHEAQEMGSYHLIEQLGSGGMGEVWRAE